MIHVAVRIDAARAAVQQALVALTRRLASAEIFRATASTGLQDFFKITTAVHPVEDAILAISVGMTYGLAIVFICAPT